MFPRASVDAMHARLQSVADDMGVAFSPREHAPSTKSALAIAAFARREGRLAEWREAAMNAHWRDGRDIEDRAVLAELAAAAGLDPQRAVDFLDDPAVPGILQAQRIEAHQWGVTGIPTWFMLPEGWTPEQGVPETGPRPVRVVGCQPAEVVERAAQLAGARPR